MAGMSGSMTWDLIANSTKYVAGMSKARAATDQMSKATLKAQRQQELLGRAAGVVGVAVAAAFTKKIVSAASDLNETMSKSSVVFGKAAGSVQKWSTTSAKAFGMSQNAALGAAATYGNLFVSMGLAEDKAADMSTQLVELAGDLASFNNVSSTEALDALRSGLVGETEPLRRFGVNLSDAEMRVRALNMGLVESTKDVLPPAVKAQVAYATILEQTKTAQGDYARTADGLANSQRTLTAQWEDLQAKLGEGVLPAANGVVGAMNSLLTVANAAPAPVRNTALAAAAAGVAFLALAPRIVATKAALAELPKVSTAASRGLKAATAAVIAFTVAQTAVQALTGKEVNSGLTDLETTLRNIAAGGDDINKLGITFGAIVPETESFGAAVERAFAPTLWDRISRSAGSLLGVGSSMETSEEAVRAVDAALADLVKNGYGGEAYRARERMIQQLRDEGRDVTLLSDQALPNYRDALNSVTRYQGDVGDSAADAAGEVKSFADAIEELNSPTRDLAEAQMALIENAADLATGLKDNGKSFDMSTEAGRKNLDQLLETIEGIEDYGAAIEAKTGSQDKARAAVLKERDALIKNLSAMTGNAKQAQRLVDRYLKIPAATKAAADGIDDVSEAIRNMPSEKTITINIKGNNVRLLAPGSLTMASGGPVVGPGSGTSDSVPAMLSNGEWVMTASAVSKYGPDFMAAVNEGRLQRLAGGGAVDAGFAGVRSGSGRKRRRRRSSSGGSGGASMTWDRSVRDSVRDSNSLFDGFDMGAWAEGTDRITDAQERLTQSTEALADARKGLVSAEDDVVAARRAVNQAGSPEEQARAEKQLAEALRRRVEAQREVADAQKAEATAAADKRKAEDARKGTALTSNNVVAKYRQRAQKLDKFRRDLQALRRRGLSRAILQELIDAGIDEGGAMAAALVAGNDIGKLNQTYRNITADSRGIARVGLLTEAEGTEAGGSGGGGTTGSTGSSSTVALTFVNATKPVILKVDSEAVWKGLLKLKKAKGGASLGLS